MALKFDIDVNAIANQLNEFKEEIKSDLTKAVGNLATMTHAKVLELARDNLHSTSKKYMDNVEFTNPMTGLWIVTLKEPAMWIESGLSQHSMVDDLLRKDAKVSAEGKKYKVIPFEHSKAPTQQTPKAQDLANQINKYYVRSKIRKKFT